MWDNFRTEVGLGAAPGGQLTLKDDSDAKIPKGPKIKEKNLKSYKAEPLEKAKESNKTKKIGQGAAPGGQLTFKDESGAKIPKGPKIKEKNLKSDKPEKAQECVRI